MSSSISLNSQLNMTEASLRTKVKRYKKRVDEIEEYLVKNPEEWGKFQGEFNWEMNSVFRDIMNFERENIAIGRDDKVYKLKRIFTKKIRKMFERGDLTKWILEKPYGYAGDFKIIEDVYQNSPTTIGFDRLFDNYVQMSAISVAVRNRKNDFKKMITNFVSKRLGTNLRIMDLACGPCREIKELLFEKPELYKNVVFDCYDSDKNALKFSSEILSQHSNINFVHENAARIAFRKDINSLINKKYDIIYSTGLFDYFEERLATRLIENLKKLLTKNGAMIISDVRDKFSNPSVHFMEWVGEWDLVYCQDDKFKDYFTNAGFKSTDLKIDYEQQGILQYIMATNK